MKFCCAQKPLVRWFMISTGTGIAPFISIMRDPETYEKFENLILTHTCRSVAELQYGFECVEETKNDPLIGELAQEHLLHFASTTREASANQGRITPVSYTHLTLPTIY